jgi:hypothetical protein
MIDSLWLLLIGVVLSMMLVVARFSPRSRRLRKVTGLIYLALTICFVLYPLLVTCFYLFTDDGLRSASPSRFAYSLHRSLSRKIPEYVEKRIESRVASTLSISQITATESPVYGAFFYLQATVKLQQQWEKDPSLASVAPKISGREAIDSSLRLMLDADHAHWIKTYWGDDYMQDPNCFYRALMIGSITAHHLLTGDRQHLPLLQNIVDDLADDISQSPHGYVDDYPSQCFPCDVACGIAMIDQAGKVLQQDRSEWAKVAYARMAENDIGDLPPYMADQKTGIPQGPTRGCTNGFFFSYLPKLSPDTAEASYQHLVDEFWQEKYGACGWREFSRKGSMPSSYFDPDSGPVIGGFGTGATGLGIGYTRIFGDHHRAGALGAEMLASAVPLPSGILLLPRLVSDHQHAPYFAELVILHQLSMLPENPATDPQRAAIPPVVWGILLIEVIVLVLLSRICWFLLRGNRYLTQKPVATLS